MNLFTMSLTAAGLALSLGLVPATDAGAKSHDNGVSTDPGGPPAGGRSAQGSVGGNATSAGAQSALGPGTGQAVSGTGAGAARDPGGEPGFSDGKGAFGGDGQGAGAASSD